jgi:GNAT superfamily N-acetyltransferase
VRARSWQAAYAHVFPPERLDALTEEADDWVARWEALISKPPPRAHFLVAERAGDVVGYSHLGDARGVAGGSEGELYAIYVLPGVWGGGVGQALMAETLARLKEEGFEQAILWVLEDNPRTRRFYELVGWHADGGVKCEEWLGTSIREVRYRIDLRGQ